MPNLEIINCLLNFWLGSCEIYVFDMLLHRFVQPGHLGEILSITRSAPWPPKWAQALRTDSEYRSYKVS